MSKKEKQNRIMDAMKTIDYWYNRYMASNATEYFKHIAPYLSFINENIWEIVHIKPGFLQAFEDCIKAYRFENLGEYMIKSVRMQKSTIVKSYTNLEPHFEFNRYNVIWQRYHLEENIVLVLAYYSRKTNNLFKILPLELLKMIVSFNIYPKLTKKTMNQSS
jgi:hypothetical protein